MKKTDRLNILKRTTRSCSASAAAVTIALHLMLIVFAGSWVVFRHVQKQNAQLTAWTEDRPKLERRKLQSPARVEQLQKRALASKIVSKKISFSTPEFVLPDTGAIGSIKTQKSGLPGVDVSRALKNLVFSPGIGPMAVNFFGVRAESEKAVFVVDASPAMLSDSTGGFETYDYIKRELRKTVIGMKPSMLFNLIFYDGARIFMFQPQMVPVTKSTAEDLSEWIQQINPDPSVTGLTDAQDNYVRPEPYPTAVGADADGWLLALQAAFEQHADNVFLLCSEWGKHGISAEKRELLRNFSLWELLTGGGKVSIGGASVLRDDRNLRDALIRQAVDSIKTEEDTRKDAGLPAGFLHDIPSYIEYPADQLLAHAETVCRLQYISRGLTVPQVHAVRLVPEDQYGRIDDTSSNLRNLTRNYNGVFEALSSDQAALEPQERVRSDYRSAADTRTGSDETPKPEIQESTVDLLGAEITGKKIAFLLNISAADMASEKTGGTNTFEWIKTKILGAVAELRPKTYFNVIAYDGKQVVCFREQMIPAAEGGDVGRWLAGIHVNRKGESLPETGLYIPPEVYNTAIGEDVQDLPLAVQAAMENQADTILVVSTDIGPQLVSPKKAARLLDFSIWGALGSSSGTASTEEEEMDDEGNPVPVVSQRTPASSGTLLQALQQDKKIWSALLKQTLDRIEAEKKARKDVGLPPGFVPDILNSIEYPRSQVFEHIATVSRQNYASRELREPVINFLCLTESDTGPSHKLSRDLIGLTQSYQGNITFFNAPGTAW